MKSFELHRIKDATVRRAAFEDLEPKIWWEKNVLPTLVIADPEIGAEVMRNTNFVVPDLRGLASAVASRHSVSIDYLQEALELLPPFLEGERHAWIRKLIGQYLSVKLREIEPELPGLIHSLLHQLPRPGETDLIRQLLAPLTKHVFSGLAGRELTAQIMDFKLAKIFEMSHTVGSFGKLDNVLERTFAFLDKRSDGDEEFICQLCSLVFGVDNVMSTLAENLAAAFQTSNGTAPALLPDFPVEAMISSTHRRAVMPDEIAGHRVQPNDIIRIHIEPFGYSREKTLNAALFGVGRHACIGKQLTMRIWKHLSEQFNAQSMSGTIMDYQSEHTHSFNFVRTLKVSILP